MIRDADQILVVDNGKIVEKGVHAELIQQKRNLSKILEYPAESAELETCTVIYALRRAICRLPQCTSTQWLALINRKGGKR